MEMLSIVPPAWTRTGSLILAAAVGSATIEPHLAMLAPLHRRLGRGEVVLVDDGTLTGADRVRAARACADPRFVPTRAAGADRFPDGPEWTLLLSALDGRRNGYWVVFGEAQPIDAALPGIGHAIASNRSFALLGDAAPEDLEPHLGMLAKEGWPYLLATRNVVGFAAGGDGPTLAAAVLARLEMALGTESARRPEMAGIVANFVLAREREPVLMRDKPGTVHSPHRI
jgi:hypothetical protein